MKKNSSLFRLAITTGDQDGVGPEVTYKALATLGPCKGVGFIVFRSSNVNPFFLRLMDSRFDRKEVRSLEEALAIKATSNTLIDVVSDEPPPIWVETVARAAIKKQIAGIINAPMSKTLIQKAGLKEVGHTEILSRIAKTGPVTMSFWGPKFSVALVTTHIPLKKISSALVTKKFLHHLRQVALFFPKNPKKSFRIGIVGLNPHAGEAGLIGDEETIVFSPALKKIRREFPQILFSDPLVPDAAFLEKNQKNHDLFFCSYHDQGLIPFKLVHGQTRGCQISLGLPFVRTSVDHGTAKDLFNKNKAHAGSMLDALSRAVLLVRAGSKKHSAS